MFLLIRERMLIVKIYGSLPGDPEIEKWSGSRTPMRTLPVFASDLKNAVGGKRGAEKEECPGNRMCAYFDEDAGHEKDERDASHRETPEPPPERRRRNEPDEIRDDREDEDRLQKGVQGVHG